MNQDWLKDPVGSAERGENPTVIHRTKSGFVVIGITQFLPGYCILFASPKIDRLESLDRKSRAQFLDDMGLLGDAVAEVCKPRRVNYAIYGNTEPVLHAHVFPRYDWEPPARVKRPVWEYGEAHWNDPAHAYSEEKHGALKRQIAEALARIAQR